MRGLKINFVVEENFYDFIPVKLFFVPCNLVDCGLSVIPVVVFTFVIGAENSLSFGKDYPAMSYVLKWFVKKTTFI